MRKRIKIKTIVILATIFTICLGVLAITVSEKKTVIAETNDSVFIANENTYFEMLNSVKLRIDDDGFAFKARIDKGTYKGIEEDDNKSINFIIVPETKLSLIPSDTVTHYYRAIARYTDDGEGHKRGDYDASNSVCVYVSAGAYYDQANDCYYLQAGVGKLAAVNQQELNYYAVAVIEERLYDGETLTGFNYTYADLPEGESEMPGTNLYYTVTAALYNVSNDYLTVINDEYSWYGTNKYPVRVESDSDYDALTSKYDDDSSFFEDKYYYVKSGVETDESSYPLERATRTVTLEKPSGETIVETVEYGSPVRTPVSKGDFLYWELNSEEYSFESAVIDDIVLTPKNAVATTGSNTLASKEKISGDFRAEFFIGKEELNFDYVVVDEDHKAKEEFGAQIRFYAANNNVASFQLLRYDNRIQFKYYNGETGTGITLMTLTSESTTNNPVYTMAGNFPEEIAKSLIKNNGITMALERKGSAYDMYIKVGEFYYPVATNINLSALGASKIISIQLQSSNATSSNEAFVKGFYVERNPDTIKTIGCLTKTDASANGGAREVIATGLGSDFRVSSFIGQEDPNLEYDALASGDIWKTQITFRDSSNNTQSFLLFRYNNRIIVRDSGGSCAKDLFAITEDGFTQGSGAHFSDEITGIFADEVLTKKGITVVVEKNGSVWTLYVKVNSYYKIGTVTNNTIGEITQLELFGGVGTSSENKSFAKNTTIDLEYVEGVLPLSYYNNENTDDYDKDLFYRNDWIYQSPDPFVLDDTARSGYYYIYSTNGYLYARKSKDLATWQRVGNTLSVDYQTLFDESFESLWAPEVVYDESEGLYYAFFSARPAPEDISSGYGVESGNSNMISLYIASSTSPEGPFVPINFRDSSAITNGYYHTYNTTTGRGILSSTNGTELRRLNDNGTAGYIFAYPYDFTEYLYFNPQDMRYYMKNLFGDTIYNSSIGNGIHGYGMFQLIDAHPFVDSNGDKYLYFVTHLNDKMGGRIFGIKMTGGSWLTPDWSTLTQLSVYGYYTIADYNNSLKGQSVSTVPYENDDKSSCNEGPCVVKHNGKYYLTISSGGWNIGTYSLVQEVSDYPLGPFRKLTPEENGQFLNPDTDWTLDYPYEGCSKESLGCGHHSFVQAGDKLLIVYHKYKDYNNPGGVRHFCVDEAKWITVEGIDVLYVNGATDTEQPLFIGEYDNVAVNATITGDADALVSGSSFDYLNDGLLSIYKNANQDFISENIRETTITKTTTIELSFDRLQAVRAIMIYNSKNSGNIFKKISSIEFVCDENGTEMTYTISDLAFDVNKYAEDDGLYFSNVVRGSSVYAAFDEIAVKKIRITIDVPDKQIVGISEIRVVGKAYCTVSFDTNGGTITEDQTVKEGEKVNRPDDPEKANTSNTIYKFVGWYIGDAEFDFDSEINADVTVTAKWDTETYSNDLPIRK